MPISSPTAAGTFASAVYTDPRRYSHNRLVSQRRMPDLQNLRDDQPVIKAIAYRQALDNNRNQPGSVDNRHRPMSRAERSSMVLESYLVESTVYRHSIGEDEVMAGYSSGNIVSDAELDQAIGYMLGNIAGNSVERTFALFLNTPGNFGLTYDGNVIGRWSAPTVDPVTHIGNGLRQISLAAGSPLPDERFALWLSDDHMRALQNNPYIQRFKGDAEGAIDITDIQAYLQRSVFAKYGVTLEVGVHLAEYIPGNQGQSEVNPSPAGGQFFVDNQSQLVLLGPDTSGPAGLRRRTWAAKYFARDFRVDTLKDELTESSEERGLWDCGFANFDRRLGVRFIDMV
jgi:hypothetical protein